MQGRWGIHLEWLVLGPTNNFLVTNMLFHHTYYFDSSLFTVASFCSFWEELWRILLLWVFKIGTLYSPSLQPRQAAGNSGRPPEQIMTWYFNIHSEHCLFPWAVRHMALWKSAIKSGLSWSELRHFRECRFVFPTSINLNTPLSIASPQGQQVKFPHSGINLN